VTVSKENTPDDIKQAMEHLIHVVSQHKGACVVGYVFNHEPIFISQFGNVKPDTFRGTVQRMLELTKMKEAQGLVITSQVRRLV